MLPIVLDRSRRAGAGQPYWEHWRRHRETERRMKVVVCGGGVIGASTAYFLSRRGAEVTIVERTGVACASSGKVGALLSPDWNQATPVDSLARRSFMLHEQLTHEMDGDWCYQGVDTYGAYPISGGELG